MVIREFHPGDVATDEAEQVYRMFEVGAISHVAQVSLVETIPRQAEVDSFEAIVVSSEQVTPGVLVVDSFTKGERITRAKQSNPALRQVRGDLACGSEPLCVIA
jgi:hypothetical protein